MANQENTTPEVPVITEQDIIEAKTPWYKWPLRIAGYILTGGAGVLLGWLIRGGSDDDDEAPAEETTEE